VDRPELNRVVDRTVLSRLGLGAAWVCACASAPKTAEPAALPPASVALPAPPPAPPREQLLSILSLNDLHGRVGAVPAFAGYFEALRRARGDRGTVLAVDAGDMFQGTIGSNYSEGACVVRAYNALGMTVAALGNHEFDYGPIDGAPPVNGLLPQGALRARIAEAEFPYLSANLVATNGAFPAWDNLFRRVLLRTQELTIGFVGVITRETPSIVMPDYFAGLDVADLATAVREQATALRREGAHVVIAIAHAGAECQRFDNPRDLSSCDTDTSELFQTVRQTGPGLVDAWIGGHTHAGAAHYVDGVPVVEAYSRGKAFGRVDLRLVGSPPRVVEARPFPPEPLCPDSAELAPCETHDYEGQKVVPSQAVADVIAPALEVARRERQRSLEVEIRERLSPEHDIESPLGNLFVDLMLKHFPSADFAIANGGSLRAALPEGPLSYGELYEAMPFDNRIVTLELNGGELRQVFERHLSADARGIVSISGIEVEAHCEGTALRVRILRRGKPIADDTTLTLVTSDYLASGGDMLFSPLINPRSRIRNASPLLLRDVLALELKKRRKVSAKDSFDPKHPRLRLSAPRPIRCGS
jgi:2',3'-cyclic-nucleotide 2'-phosphodiesterase (5'-nucleotidase family)